MRVSPILQTEKNAPYSSPNPNFPCPHFGFEYIRPIPVPISEMHVHLLPAKQNRKIALSTEKTV